MSTSNGGDNVAETARLLASVPEATRLLKIVEEAGEACEAYIGMTGANPRKGVTHTQEDLASELLDVALTALVAWCGLTGYPCPMLALDEHAQSRNARHREQVPLVAGEDTQTPGGSE